MKQTETEASSVLLLSWFGQRQVGRDMVMDQDTQWLYQLLAEVQLEKFYLRVRDGLNITRQEHFAYVKESDLEQIGISKPGEPDGPGIAPVWNGINPVYVSPSSKAIMGGSETPQSEITLMDPKGLNPGFTSKWVSRGRNVTKNLPL